MTSREGKLGATAFSVLCVALAAGHHWNAKVDNVSIGLVLLGGLPWLIPMIAPLVSTLKVAGLELNFRELKQQIEENKQVAQAAAAAAVGGVGRAPVAEIRLPSKGGTGPGGGGEHVSHGVPMPGLNEAETGGDEDATGDPNAGQFGGSPERGGRRLQAEVKPMPGSADMFLIHTWVSASVGGRPLSDGTIVTFHLHPTFVQSAVNTPVRSGVAALDRIAWGSFTIGAEVEGIRLELNLAEVAGAPDLFRQR